jgi:hypothetical protein
MQTRPFLRLTLWLLPALLLNILLYAWFSQKTREGAAELATTATGAAEFREAVSAADGAAIDRLIASAGAKLEELRSRRGAPGKSCGGE